MVCRRFIILRMIVLLFCSVSEICFAKVSEIVTSIKPLAFITAAVANGVVETQVLLPDGASPHTYALKPSDLKLLHDAKLVVWIGSGMENFLVKSLEAKDSSEVLTLESVPQISKMLVQDSDHEHADEHQQNSSHERIHKNFLHSQRSYAKYNMHIWLSPAIAQQIAITIHDKLAKLYPSQNKLLDRNLSSFLFQLQQTQANISAILKSIHGVKYFIFHDAYYYFENQFGLHPVGSFTVNPVIQPGAKKLLAIKEELRNNNVACIFAEPQYKPALIASIIQGTSVRQGTLDPLGVGIPVNKDSYTVFLTQLANQYVSCLSQH